MFSPIARLQRYISRWRAALHHIWQRFTSLWLALLFLAAAALPITAQNGNVNPGQRNPIEQIQEANQHQEREEFDDAITLLKSAADTFKQNGDFANQAIALSNLAFVYQKQKNWQEAVAAIDRSVGILGAIANGIPFFRTA